MSSDEEDFAYARASALMTKTEPTIDEKESIRRFQERVVNAAWNDILKVIGSVTFPSEIWAVLVREEERLWVKLAVAASVNGDPLPSLPRLWPWGEIDPDRGSSLPLLLQGTRYARLEPFLESGSLFDLQIRLDGLGLRELGNYWETLPDDEPLKAFLKTETTESLAFWARRMRFYYGWKEARLDEFFGEMRPTFRRAAGTVFSTQEYDSQALDLVALEKDLLSRRRNRARLFFHTHPCSIAGLYGFCRWKQHEAVRSAAAAEASRQGVAA